MIRSLLRVRGGHYVSCDACSYATTHTDINVAITDYRFHDCVAVDE